MWEVFVKITDSSEGRNKQLLHVRVCDHGPGIAPADVATLFKSFRRLDNDVAHGTVDGTGLGLCIAKELVDLMGGEIGVESTLGVGSVFFFSLPCEVGDGSNSKLSSSSPSLFVSLSTQSNDDWGAGQLAAMVADRARARNLQAVEGNVELAEADFLSFSLPRPLQVLVVDDMLVNLKLMIKSVARLGAMAHGASSGQEALAMAKEHTFDVILLDFFMPGMDGAETCKALRQDPAYENLPIICVTASLLPIDPCFSDYLPKPFSTNQLQDLLDKWTIQPALEEESKEESNE